MSLNLTRQQYCEIYGPTLGDQVRLGDTDLFIEVAITIFFGHLACFTLCITHQITGFPKISYIDLL